MAELTGFILIALFFLVLCGPFKNRKRNLNAWKQQYQEAELNRILEKIHQKGINSLTHKEKEILEIFSSKI